MFQDCPLGTDTVDHRRRAKDGFCGPDNRLTDIFFDADLIGRLGCSAHDIDLNVAKTMFNQMVTQPRHRLFRVNQGGQPHIQFGARLVGHNRLAARPLVATGQPGNVAGRFIGPRFERFDPLTAQGKFFDTPLFFQLVHI